MNKTKAGRLYACDVLSAMGIENPVWDQQGSHGLITEEGVAFSIGVDPDSDVITLRSQINGSSDRRPFLERLLEANFLWHGTQGAVFVIENSKPVLVRQVDPMQVTGEQFREIAESFLNTAANWDAAARQAWDSGPDDADHAVANQIQVKERSLTPA